MKILFIFLLSFPVTSFIIMPLIIYLAAGVIVVDHPGKEVCTQTLRHDGEDWLLPSAWYLSFSGN